MTVADPEFVIGTSSEPSDDLYRVRGALLLQSGRIAIANAGSSQILFFEGPGEPVQQFGREGEGPEEFSNILWIQGIEPEGLVVSDAGNHKLVYLDALGTFQRSKNLIFEPEDDSSDGMMVSRGFAIGVASAGQVIAAPWAAARLDGIEGPVPLLGELRTYAPDLSTFTAVDSIRLRTWYEVEQEDGPPIAQVYGAPVFLFSANGTSVAYSDATTHRITVLEQGRPGYVVQEVRSRLPFAPDSIPSFYPVAADSFPAYRDLRVDSDGRIWVQAQSSTPDGPIEWRVFSDRGRRVHAVSLPVTTRILDARGDRAVLLERDDFDVERVTVRRLLGLTGRP